jgi:hypothetical protein
VAGRVTRIASIVVSVTAFGCLALGGVAHATAIVGTAAPDSLPGLFGTATTLTASPDPAVTNEIVTLTATVSSGIGAPYPAGTVAFANGDATIRACGDVPVSPTSQSVKATCSIALAASTAQLTAAFTPGADSMLTGSVSPIESVSVEPGPSSTSLGAPSTVDVGIRAIYTASVTTPSTAVGATEPGGAVEFLDAGQPISSCSSQPLMDGVATCAVTYRGAGAHAITARYLGDANFVASNSATELVRAIPTSAARAGAPGSAPGIVTATMQWAFSYAPSYTIVRALVVNGTPPAATVLVDCHGRGCPFSRRVANVADGKRCSAEMQRMCSTHGGVVITPVFEKRHLGVGTRITVSIMQPRLVGKYYAFTIEAGRGPRIRIACLAPGTSRSTGGC